MRSKYAPLRRYLERANANRLTLTFTEIEEIIGAQLPSSAFHYLEWWGNDWTHTQAAKGWLAARWRTADVNLNNRVVHLYGIDRTYKPSRSD